MNAMILIPAIAGVVILGAGFLAVLVILLIGMRAEGSRMRQSSAPNTRTGTVARLILASTSAASPKRFQFNTTT